MSQHIEPVSTVHATAGSRWSSTRRLLSAGIVAGPVFITIWALQACTREGFDPNRHPISLLSLGDLGWIQVASFTVTGALFVACAVGMRRAMGSETAGTWGPRLVGVLHEVGFVMGMLS